MLFVQVGLEFQTRLLNVNLTAVDKATQKEVEMFLIAIQKNPPTMNLDGYADINRGLITSVSFSSSFLRHQNINFDLFSLLNRMCHLWQPIWSFCYNSN